MEKPFVIVAWEDPNSSATEVISEENIEDFHKGAEMETGGWLLRDDTTGISLACERYYESGKARYRGHTFIPRALARGMRWATFTAKPRKARGKRTARITTTAEVKTDGE